MTDTVKAWIEERRTIHNEATEGPLVAEYSGENGDCVIPHDAQSTREAVAVTRLFHRTADANAIADAHNMFPHALDALEDLIGIAHLMDEEAREYEHEGRVLAAQIARGHAASIRSAIESALEDGND